MTNNIRLWFCVHSVSAGLYDKEYMVFRTGSQWGAAAEGCDGGTCLMDGCGLLFACLGGGGQTDRYGGE